ncbi:hypothetical protein HDU87_000488 [Geranomyces variabilis]|uniref:Uncharacterized protein n=1 Tax=Geranomyces variabilis TaxID=109894 RepID=A0AAD5XNX4_9FUNG|nr:hypothetical protein HDU87_000488 [Geranomyces variabilis]
MRRTLSLWAFILLALFAVNACIGATPLKRKVSDNTVKPSTPRKAQMFWDSRGEHNDRVIACALAELEASDVPRYDPGVGSSSSFGGSSGSRSPALPCNRDVIDLTGDGAGSSSSLGGYVADKGKGKGKGRAEVSSDHPGEASINVELASIKNEPEEMQWGNDFTSHELAMLEESELTADELAERAAVLKLEQDEIKDDQDERKFADISVYPRLARAPADFDEMFAVAPIHPQDVELVDDLEYKLASGLPESLHVPLNEKRRITTSWLRRYTGWTFERVRTLRRELQNIRSIKDAVDRMKELELAVPGRLQRRIDDKQRKLTEFFQNPTTVARVSSPMLSLISFSN